MSELLDIKINLEKKDATYHIGECLKGEIVLVPQMDLDVNFFAYNVLLELRGQLEQSTDVTQTNYIIKNQYLVLGETYRYPIEWLVSGPETYDGIKAEFLWKIETSIRFNEKTRIAIKNNYLKTLSLYKAISYEKKLKAESYLTVLSGKYDYLVEEQRGNCTASSLPNYIFGGIFLMLAGILLLPLWWKYVFAFMLVYIAIFLFHYFYVRFVFGSATLTLSPINDESFDMRFDVEKNGKQIHKAKLYYQIGETVVDRRGTSVVSRNSVVYKSPEKNVKGHNRALHAKFDYPEKKYPASLQMKDVTVYWEAVLTFYVWFGFRFSYKKRFRVNKKYSNTMELT